jgi:uncharacterized protein YaaQ
LPHEGLETLELYRILILAWKTEEDTLPCYTWRMSNIDESVMKLIFMVIRNTDADTVVQSLVKNHYRVTRMASTGGFMRHGNVTLITGVEEDRVETVIDLLHQECCPPEDAQPRATVFVVDMPFFEQI